MKLDIGSRYTLIPEDLWENIGRPSRSEDAPKMAAFGKTAMLGFIKNDQGVLGLLVQVKNASR
jgi:hypothetical protein